MGAQTPPAIELVVEDYRTFVRQFDEWQQVVMAGPRAAVHDNQRNSSAREVPATIDTVPDPAAVDADVTRVIRIRNDDLGLIRGYGERGFDRQSGRDRRAEKAPSIEP